MTPAPTVERSAVSQIPDPRQRQLIELVRSRDAAATSRLLEAWVHRRGLASLDTFRHDAVPALFSEADALWLEECIQEPLERRPLKPEATVEAQAPVPPVEVPPATALPSHSQPVAGGDSQPTPTALASVAPQAAILHPAGPRHADLEPSAMQTAAEETAAEKTAAVEAAAVEAAAMDPASWQPPTARGFVSQPPPESVAPSEPSWAGENWSQPAATSQPATPTLAGERPTPGPAPAPLTALRDKPAGPWPGAGGRATASPGEGLTAVEPPFARRHDGPTDHPGPDAEAAGAGRLDQELQPAGFEPWLITGSEAERPAAAAAPSSLSSLDATAAPAAPSDLGGTLSAQPQADLPPRANGPLAELAHGLEPGLTAASAVLADAPQRLRRKLFGSLGKARELMQACFEEAISTLHPRAEEELEPETESRFGLIPAAAASRTPTAGSLDGASGDIPSLAPRSGGSQGEPAPDPIDSAPAAAWTPSLSGSLPAAASLDKPLPGPPAPTPAALADLRAWLPGSSSGHERRAS